MTSMLIQFPLGSARSAGRLLDNRAPVLEEFSDGAVAVSGQPIAAWERKSGDSLCRSLLARYRERGAEFLRDLTGEFALVIRLEDQDRTLIAIDRMGISRLAWSLNDSVLTAGTSASEVATHAGSDGGPTIDPQAMFNFMLCHMIPAPDTIFENVSKLLPATALEFEGPRSREIRYWQPTFERPGSFDAPAAREQTLRTLQTAIEQTEPDAETGTFLSGGLDSSTITGLYQRVNDKPVDAFSIGFGIDAFNEMSFARAASNHFGCTHHTYEVTADDIVEVIPKIASTFDEPFGNSSAVPTFACARLAMSKGITHLLAGDGGDELFGGNERYVRQTVFEKYQLLPKAVRSQLLSPAAAWLDPETSLFPLRKFSSYVRQAEIPLPDRFESWNLIFREGPGNVFSPDFLANVEPEQPLELMRTVWASCPGEDLLDRMLWYDWKFTLADNDIRKVRTMCDLAGVRVSFPMLDEEFVDLSISVPSDHKIRNGELRSFFKESVRNYLPNEVITKTKHGFGLPFGDWLKSHGELRDLVYDSITRLRTRGIVREDFLDRVLEEHKTGHSGYYGYAIWDLVMLEQWLQSHARSHRR